MASKQEPISDRILSQGQGDRFDRWVEFLGALVLSAATVATAWCAYQAALWSGDESRSYFEASAAQVDAAQMEDRGLQRAGFHISLFVEYIAALSQDNQVLADFLYKRFPPELKTATDAWLAEDPFTNPDAPDSPFKMPEYRLQEEVAAEEMEQLAVEKFAEAGRADEHADNYVLLTVIFAMALFFSGISGKFQWRVIDAVVLALGAIVLLGGLVLLAQMPMQ